MMTAAQKLFRTRIAWILTIATFSYYGWMIGEWIHIGRMPNDELKRHEREMAERETGYRMPTRPYFIRRPSRRCDSWLKINASKESDFVLRLVDVYSGKTVLDYFLPAGTVKEIQVPSGSYEIRYATGNKWYGDDKMFGESARFSKADKTFSFSENGGYELTLYGVRYGNLRTKSIKPEDF